MEEYDEENSFPLKGKCMGVGWRMRVPHVSKWPRRSAACSWLELEALRGAPKGFTSIVHGQTGVGFFQFMMSPISSWWPA